MARGQLTRLIVWPMREWALNFMPLAWREQASEAAGRVVFGDPHFSLKPKGPRNKSPQGKRSRIRINPKRGHKNYS